MSDLKYNVGMTLKKESGFLTYFFKNGAENGNCSPNRSLLGWRGEEKGTGQEQVCHILGQVMQLAISIYYIKMKSLILLKLWQKAKCTKKKKKRSNIFLMCTANNLNIPKKNSQSVLSCYIISVTLAIQKVCSHEQFQGDLRGDGEFRYLCWAVGVTDLVGEVHADLGEDMRGDLSEVHLVGFILSKLTCRRVTVVRKILIIYNFTLCI